MACFFDPFKPNGANVAIRAVNPNFLKTKMDGLLLFNLPVARVLEGCGDEAAKQGMGGHGPGFELRVELASQIPGVISISTISTNSPDGAMPEMLSPAFQRLHIGIVELESVAMPLGNGFHAVGPVGDGVGFSSLQG
jgi:hypothetical protein